MGCAESSEENILHDENDAAYPHNYHEQIEIKHNSVGYSYQTVFGKFLTPDVTFVVVQDPYIRNYHQCQNLLRLCELLVKRCPNLRTIQLLTAQDTNSDQGQWLGKLQSELIKQRLDNKDRQRTRLLQVSWRKIYNRMP